MAVSYFKNGSLGNWPLDEADFKAGTKAETTAHDSVLDNGVKQAAQAGADADGNVYLRLTDEFGMTCVTVLPKALAAELATALETAAEVPAA